jgi:integrase
VVAGYIERQAKRNRTWRETERTLNRELADWMDRPLAKITRRDVIEILDRTAARAPYLANRLRSQLSTLFKWAIGRGIVNASPVTGIAPPGAEESRDRLLTAQELAAVWRACDGLGWPYGPIVRLLVLTAQRRGEVAGMTWSSISHNEALWTLPREATKAKRIHDVPLSAPALAIIAELPMFAGTDLVFPAMRGGGPVEDFSHTKVKLDRLSGVRDWRFHDLRRTTADGMARLGHPPHVVAAILNHSPGPTLGITSVYVRYRFTDERRLAMDAWCSGPQL